MDKVQSEWFFNHRYKYYPVWTSLSRYWIFNDVKYNLNTGDVANVVNVGNVALLQIIKVRWGINLIKWNKLGWVWQWTDVMSRSLQAFDSSLLHGHPSRRSTSTTSSAVDIIGRALKHWKLPSRRLTYYNAQAGRSRRPVIIISSYDYFVFCPFASSWLTII